MEGVLKGGAKKPPRVGIYGPPGIGKSTFGADSPKVIVIPAEDGVDNISVDQFPKIKDWPSLLATVKKVATEKHEYQTVCLDTVNGACELAAKMICDSMFGGNWTPGKGKEGFLQFDQGWKAVAEEIRNLLDPLDACRARGMTVILLAHTGIQNVKNPIAGEYTKFCPDINRNPWARISAWLDIIGRADYEYTVVKDSPKGKGRAVGTTTRCLYFAGSAAEDAKCRVGYELPDSMPLSWEHFAAALGKKASTLEELKSLWPTMSKDEEKKALIFLGLINIAGLDTAPITKARQLVDRLRQKASDAAAAAQPIEQKKGA